MSTSKMRLFSMIFCIFMAGCSGDLFLTHCGNMPSSERIAKVKIGDSKQQVISLLGSPSSVVSLDQNTWIYMSSDIRKIAFMSPQEVNRDVLTISFNKDGYVNGIDRLAKQNGKEIDVNTDRTETLGHNPGFFEKFFGGLGGNYMPFPGVKTE